MSVDGSGGSKGLFSVPFAAKLDVLGQYLADRVFRLILWVALALPWRARLAVAGFVVAHVVAPLGGWRRRVRENLALIFPDMPRSEVRRMERAVPANIGRTLIEIYSGAEFVARVAPLPLTGPGAEALMQAHAAGRPILWVTGHIGNYDALRGALTARGFQVGALYKPMRNRFFNRHYVAAMHQIGQPLFPRGKAGLAGMVRHLKAGNMLLIVHDQAMSHGVMMDFMGQPALTALSPGELALRHDALLIPGYGLRRGDGGYELWIDAPIAHSTPEVMVQQLNDSLGAQVRAHPDQWLWTHRRWKDYTILRAERQARRERRAFGGWRQIAGRPASGGGSGEGGGGEGSGDGGGGGK